MAKKKDEVEKSEVVTPVEEKKELVVTKGVGATLFDESSSGLFVPIRDDLPIEQRRDAVRQVLMQAAVADDKLSLVKGEMLFEASENAYWKEWSFKPTDETTERAYASFDEYCQEEIGLKKRTGYYLISIYKKFVMELDLPRAVLKDLEWSKAKELVNIISAENAGDLLDKISGMSLSQVKNFVSDHKKIAKGEKPDAEREPAETKKKIQFNLNVDQLQNVNEALEIAGSLTDSDDKNKQLDMICAEFKAGTVGMGLEGALSKLDIIIKDIERAFGVKIEVTELADERYDSTVEDDEVTDKVTDEVTEEVTA